MLGLHQSNIYNSWKHNKESKFQIETTRVIIKQSGAETSGIHKATTKCIEKHSKLTTHWSKGSTPKSNSTSKVIPLMKHLPWIRFLDFKSKNFNFFRFSLKRQHFYHFLHEHKYPLQAYQSIIFLSFKLLRII